MSLAIEVAQQIFVTCMAEARGLGSFSKEERAEMFKQLADLALEAGGVFAEVVVANYSGE